MPIWDAQATLKVDTAIYSKTSLFRACYKFTDRAYIFLSRSDDEPHLIVVSFTVRQTGDDPQLLSQQFCNELIDQGIREALEKEHASIRNLIVAQAFSEGNLLEDGAPLTVEDDLDGLH